MPRGMTHCCDSCHHSTPELLYCRATDEHLCEECIMALAIAYYEAQRQCDDIDPPPTTDPFAMMEE